MGNFLLFLLAFYIERVYGLESRLVSVLPFLSSPESSILSSVAYHEEDELVFVFGGANSRISTIYSEFYIFNVTDETWIELTSKSSLKPPEIYSAFSFSLNYTFYILFGRTQSQISLEFYSFDLISEEWSLQVLKGQKIEPVVESATESFEFEGRNYFAIHGGVANSGPSSALYL